MGERSPIWDARASGAFIGLGLHHGREHLYRAVLEGISYALHHNIETGTRGGQPLDEALTVVGGAARSTCGCRSSLTSPAGRCSAATSTPKRASARPCSPRSAPASSPMPRRSAAWVRRVERARPDGQACARYAALYRPYVAAYPALKSVMPCAARVSRPPIPPPLRIHGRPRHARLARRPLRGTIGTTWQASTPWWPDAEAASAEAHRTSSSFLYDDVGFGSFGSYGAEIATPTMDALGCPRASATTTSTSRRSARRRARRCSPVATTTASGWRSSPTPTAAFPDRAATSRSRRRRSPKC
jgi:hypothetical protein